MTLSPATGPPSLIPSHNLTPNSWGPESSEPMVNASAGGSRRSFRPG
jgi:hypothetical protein